MSQLDILFSEESKQLIAETKLRYCPVTTCLRQISNSFPMCGGHWKMLSDPMKTSVREAMRLDCQPADRHELISSAVKEIDSKILLASETD